MQVQSWPDLQSETIFKNNKEKTKKKKLKTWGNIK